VLLYAVKNKNETYLVGGGSFRLPSLLFRDKVRRRGANVTLSDDGVPKFFFLSSVRILNLAPESIFLVMSYLLILIAAVATVSFADVNVVPLTEWLATPSIVPKNIRPGFGPPPYPYTAPNTIIGSLVSAGAFSFDPLKKMNFGLLDDPAFNASWSVSTNVTMGSFSKAIIRIDGINYKGSLIVNGAVVADESSLIGTFRRFEFDVSSFLNVGLNTITISFTPPQDHSLTPSWNNNSTDLAITFVDWNPEPADHMMGLWRPVELHVLDASQDCFTAQGLSVDTKIPDEDQQSATLNISFILRNWCSSPRDASIVIRSHAFGEAAQVASFAAGEYEKRVIFDPDAFDNLNIPEPAFWWPWQMGNPALHTLHVAISGGSELMRQSFGIRQIEKRLVAPFDQVQFFVNKLPMQVRGGGWTPDIFLRNNETKLTNQMQMVQAMGLNAIRLEGKMESELFFDLADELGLVVLPGWCCCDAWQHWSAWGPQQMMIANSSMQAQVRRLAAHPSVIVFFISSDQLPPVEVEAMYLGVASDELWPNPTVSSAGLWNSTITGTTGVKMSGPYSWVPPSYWLLDESDMLPAPYLGGAWGFLTEGGPGESPMTFDSWVLTVGMENVWGINGSMSDMWNAHCANPDGLFRNLRFFNPPLFARYGEISSAQQYTFAAQAANYEGIRAFMEGYSRNKHQGATGVIQWMMNNAYPSHIWHLYDYYLTAGGGFYGARKALYSQLHLMLTYSNGHVWVINSQYQSISASDMNISCHAQVLSLTGDVLHSAQISAMGDIDADASLHLVDLDIPLVAINAMLGPNTTYLVRLYYTQGTSTTMIDVNDYWLSTQMDVIDWKDSNFYRTPVTKFANFQNLRSLPATVNPVSKWAYDSASQAILISLLLPRRAASVAFFCHIELILNGSVMRPVYLSDNFVTLVPGELRTITASMISSDFVPALDVKVTSWNSLLGK
jgi:exo-1,4-beta-D-glucosaminidase